MTSLLGPSSGTHDDLPRFGRADAGSFSLSDRYTRDSGTIFLTGIQALVRTIRDRARLDRRQNLLTASLVSGYEGSPLAGPTRGRSRREGIPRSRSPGSR